MIPVIITFRKLLKSHLSVGPALIVRVGKTPYILGKFSSS